MFELGALDVTGEFGGAEHLLEMIGLALVDDVQIEIRIEVALALQDRGHVGRAVHGRTL